MTVKNPSVPKVTSATKLPSLGFCAVILTHLGLLAFLAWGFQKPPLERVWELHHELKIGNIGSLAASDRSLLSAALARHPQLAEALLSEGDIGVVSAQTYGWLETPEATIVRSAAAKDGCDIKFDVSIPDEALPLSIKLRGSGWDKELNITEQGETSFSLPKANTVPEIIDLGVTASGVHDEVATLGVRVSFSCKRKSTRKKIKERADVDD